jgi:hypothetical protein
MCIPISNASVLLSAEFACGSTLFMVDVTISQNSWALELMAEEVQVPI